MLKEKLKMMNGVLENGNYQLGQFKFGELRKSRFVCEKPVNKRMLICIACGNGSIEYRIELSKTRRQRLC